jgi:hypothetical protein
MNEKKFLDEKGHLIGREVNGIMLDGKGKVVARYIEGSDRTVDGKGKNVGMGDQKIRQLEK